MFIHEAIKATSNSAPCVTREAWDRMSPMPYHGVKIQPTNSPDGCIIISDVDEKRRHGWQPTAADLVADDWKCVRL